MFIQEGKNGSALKYSTTHHSYGITTRRNTVKDTIEEDPAETTKEKRREKKSTITTTIISTQPFSITQISIRFHFLSDDFYSLLYKRRHTHTLLPIHFYVEHTFISCVRVFYIYTHTHNIRRCVYVIYI